MHKGKGKEGSEGAKGKEDCKEGRARRGVQAERNGIDAIFVKALKCFEVF